MAGAEIRGFCSDNKYAWLALAECRHVDMYVRSWEDVGEDILNYTRVVSVNIGVCLDH